ncbi:MAG: hypothetical protein ACOYNN_09135 [Terrimicrobiaceae bacterium]
MKNLVLVLAFVTAVQAQDVRRAVPVAVDGSPVDQLAKFLAGIPVAESSPLAKLQKSGKYREHSKAFERYWLRYGENFFVPMRRWAEVELGPRISVGLPVFYFFGGPDALAVRALYPDATDYLLGGLEPVGSLPTPEALDGPRLEAGLANLRKSTEVILSYGHFITKDMKAELELTDIRGVLPIMMAFIAMSGGEVLDVSFLGVESSGATTDFGAAYRGTSGMLPGVKITFRPNSLSAPRHIYYVQADVSDGAIGSQGAVTKWAAGFGNGNVYLKAASYLMHEPYFSKIRGFLLGHSQSILQDDSGIPLKYLRNEDWRLWFFGRYAGTLDIFKKYWQSDMDEAFRNATSPLPFGIGYKWQLGESNLVLAVRQQVPKAEAVAPEAVAPEAVEPEVIIGR